MNYTESGKSTVTVSNEVASMVSSVFTDTSNEIGMVLDPTSTETTFVVTLFGTEFDVMTRSSYAENFTIVFSCDNFNLTEFVSYVAFSFSLSLSLYVQDTFLSLFVFLFYDRHSSNLDSENMIASVIVTNQLCNSKLDARITYENQLGENVNVAASVATFTRAAGRAIRL